MEGKNQEIKEDTFIVKNIKEDFINRSLLGFRIVMLEMYSLEYE